MEKLIIILCMALVFAAGGWIGGNYSGVIISDRQIEPKMNIDCIHKSPCDTSWVYIK